MVTEKTSPETHQRSRLEQNEEGSTGAVGSLVGGLPYITNDKPTQIISLGVKLITLVAT